MKNHNKIVWRLLALVLSLAMWMTSICSDVSVNAAKKTVTVKSIELKKPAIQTLAMKKGEKRSLKIQVSPKKASKNVTYRSSKASVAYVTKAGVLTAKKVGSTKITIRGGKGSNVSAKIKVTVYKKLIQAKKVVLNSKQMNLLTGQKKKLTAKVNPQKATVKKVTFVSKNQTIAKIDRKGQVIAKKAGSTKIIAYAADGRGAKAVCKVTVRDKQKGTDGINPSASTVPTAQSQTASPSATPDLAKEEKEETFTLFNANGAVPMYLDAKSKDYDGLRLVADSFAEDVSLVSSKKVSPSIVTDKDKLGEYAVIAGTVGQNEIIDQMCASGKLDLSGIKNKWETYQIKIVNEPIAGVKKAIVIAGSDKRGTIYGIYHISELMGVSPWVYWGDVTPDVTDEITFSSKTLNVTSKEPSVKYRGIFLNDEAPSLTSWVKAKFDGYNEKFYEKVYELILRCKGNYLWPAMWSNAFSEDGESAPAANAELADKYGIVMGTSHHEPMCRAGVEWSRVNSQYGDDNSWDYNENQEAITKFWDDGIKRNKSFENVITLGMRGESDSALPGTTEENIDLLKRVITTQKQILADHKLSEAPQVFTVYKEVEAYWNGTDTVKGLKDWDKLNDVTVMLCDDNFGNMRTLPTSEEKNRAGGWGMYYHFDYHGGPISYEWVNTVELNKVWEQMTMAYEHGVDDIWIVNVGDLKPMEMNISYFLDMAYDYDTWGKNGEGKTSDYMNSWVNQQFGDALNKEQASDVKSLIDDYTWLNTCCKPETLNAATYSSVNYNEAQKMLGRINEMVKKADQYKESIPTKAQAAYYELIYYPTVASANVARIQLYSGLNKYFAENNSMNANLYAELLNQAIKRDKEMQKTYNEDIPGVGDKWKGMMSSPHVGFVSWNSTGCAYPTPVYVNPADESSLIVTMENQKDPVSKGELTCDDFTNVNQETYTVTVSNSGGTPIDYTVEPKQDWITVSATDGTVRTQDNFVIGVDWSKVKESKSGEVVIKHGSQEITIHVNAKVIDTSKLENGTYIYANGYASILPGNYVNSAKGNNGSEIHTLSGYGKMGQAIKALPTDVEVPKNVSDAPYADYLVSVDKAGDYKLTVYTGPSNNVERNVIQIQYGLAVNDGDVKTLNTVDPATFLAGEYSGSWANDVKAAGRKMEETISLNEGVNKIRIYAADPAFLLQKLVVSEKSVLTSNLGPDESYYVGKKLVAKQSNETLDVNPYCASGTIDAAGYDGSTDKDKKVLLQKDKSYEYETILSQKETYFIGVYGSSQDQAKIKVSWNDKQLGEITLGADEDTYMIPTGSELDAGLGKLQCELVSGSGSIQFISMKVKKKATIPGDYDVTNQDEKEFEFEADSLEDNKIVFSVKGSSSDQAKVSLLWNDTAVAEVELGNQAKYYEAKVPAQIAAESGIVKVKVTEGTAKIYSVRAEIYDGEVKNPVDLKASSSVSGHEANAAYDNDVATYWSPNGTKENYLEFDFGKEYSYDRFSVVQKGGKITSYKMQIPDGDAWKDVYSGNEVESGATVMIQGKETITSQKVRFVFEGSDIQVSEIRLTPYINWAMSDSVTLSGENKGGTAIDVPESVIDGDRITKGMEDGTGTSSNDSRHVVTMTFAEKHLINTVRLTTLQMDEYTTPGTGVIPDFDMTSDRAQNSYRFSYYDGSEWKVIGETVQPETGTFPKVFNEFKLKEAVEASAIRVEINTSYWIRINELEAVKTFKFTPNE